MAPQGPSGPISVFYSYSHKDERFITELMNHLSVLQRQGLICNWHDRRITAGSEWEGQIDDCLNTAGVILLLVSPDFVASDYCWDIELKRALERHERGEARVIPVILRPVDNWQAAPFGKLQAAPTGGKAVTLWSNRDKAFADVAGHIRRAMDELQDLRGSSPHTGTAEAGGSTGNERKLSTGEPSLASTAPIGDRQQDTFSSQGDRIGNAPEPRASEAVDESTRHATEKPRALIMKGGGIKGLAYVGALEILNEKYQFDWYIGTSAGAIAAVLLGAGFSTDELKGILKNKDFGDFFDAKWYQQPFNLLAHKGLHKAYTLETWLDTLIAEKRECVNRPKLSDLRPNRVTVHACQKSRRVLTFDSEKDDVPASYAVRCSMAIPYVFTPAQYQGIFAFDGGMRYNYPVELLVERDPTKPFIGLYLGPKKYEPSRHGTILEELLSIWTEGAERETIEKYQDHTVFIDTRPIGTLDFKLSDVEKEFLLQAGRVGALAHLAPDTKRLEDGRALLNRLRETVQLARDKVAARRRRHRRMQLGAITGCLVLAGGWWFWTRPADNHTLPQDRPAAASQTDASTKKKPSSPAKESKPLSPRSPGGSLKPGLVLEERIPPDQDIAGFRTPWSRSETVEFTDSSLIHVIWEVPSDYEFILKYLSVSGPGGELLAIRGNQWVSLLKYAGTVGNERSSKIQIFPFYHVGEGIVFPSTTHIAMRSSRAGISSLRASGYLRPIQTNQTGEKKALDSTH